MKIQYLGHACFRIISQLGTAIICDPYDGDMVGFEMPQLSCDVVTVSHDHGDHNCVQALKGNPAVLEKEVYLAADDVAVQSIKSWHDDRQGKLRGENFVFCFLVDGLKIVHMGDIGELDEALAARIAGCDVMLLPVGGKFTVDAQGAKWYLDKVKPKICIPMHYKTAEHSFEIGTVEQFLQLLDGETVRHAHSETLVLDDDLQNDRTEVVVLDRYVD